MESLGLFEQFLKSNSDLTTKEKLSTDVYTDFLYLNFDGIVRSVVFPKNKNFVNVTDEEEIFQMIFSKIYKIARSVNITISVIVFNFFVFSSLHFYYYYLFSLLGLRLPGPFS